MKTMRSFATDFRPNNWDEMVGQNALVNSLMTELDVESAHAFLFHGPSGCGKTTIARLSARHLGAVNTNGGLIEVDGATYNKKEDMLELAASLRYRPFNSKMKCVIVDEAHAVTADAWKSLLKIIEEPPSWVYWFFCTTDRQKIPTTIQTRCSSHELKALSGNDLTDLLVNILVKADIFCDPKVVHYCATHAEGSPRKALNNLSACIEAESREAAEAILHATNISDAEGYDLAKALLDGNWTQLQPILNGLRGKNAESIRQVVRGYYTTAILNTKDEKAVCRILPILDAFSVPMYNAADDITPIILAVGRVKFG